ncbi:synaptotagmin-2-like [Prorops nasuta]|uniref:synaptotagmin-2-like n=1 Tax=Prorops nasuta TaxID=863751 RepID=UPI0034CE0586
MPYNELFGPWGPILLAIIVSAVIIVILLLCACFFTPGCIGYECVRKPRKEGKSVPFRARNKSSNENVKLSDVSYRSWRLGSLYENGTISENGESHRESCNMNNSPLENVDSSSTLHLIKEENDKSEKKPKEFPTELTMSLQYLPPCQSSASAKLVIGIEALSSLPPKQYNCSIEPYVAVNIVKLSWSHRKRQKLHSFRTRGIRHTASPIYRETFVVADTSREAKEWVMDITAHDHDRYANHTELSSLRVPLKEVKKIFHSPEIHLFNYTMKPSNQEFGSILLGISHLPTAQRLTITVMKLRDVKFAHLIPSPQSFNPYVRILMLNGKTGRKLKKRKTKFFIATPQPEFNETLTFDLSENKLDNVQFLIILCSKAVISEQANGEPSDSEDAVNSIEKSKDICIGKTAVGKGVRGPTERLHWFSILQNPRKLVTVWHALK